MLDWPMYLKIAGIGVQNEAWRNRKSMKMVAWRVGKRGKWWLGESEIEENGVSAGSWTVLGRLLGFMMRFSRNFCRSWGEDGRSWRQVAPKMGQDSAKLGQDGAKMVSLRSTWEVFEAFWEDLGTWAG